MLVEYCFDQTALRQHNFVTRSLAGARTSATESRPTTTIYEADAGRRDIPITVTINYRAAQPSAQSPLYYEERDVC